MSKLLIAIALFVVASVVCYASVVECLQKCENERLFTEIMCYAGSYGGIDEELYESCMYGAEVLYKQCEYNCQHE